MKNVSALEVDPKLKKEHQILRGLSKLIAEKLNVGISYSIVGLEFEGNLELDDKTFFKIHIMDNNNLIEQLLNFISPEESQRIENRMLVAAKIDDALKANGWKKKDFMEAMGKKNQSEITKWLSGTHNFKIDTLTDLSNVLGVDFLNIDKPCTSLV